MRPYIWIFLVVTLPGWMGCDGPKKSALDEARSRPGKHIAEVHRVANGTCQHTPAYECMKGKPCNVPQAKTVTCPIHTFATRVARRASAS